jgi:Kef-type K+ transport system membrane component KefB/CBS domain-containing protein
MMNMLFVHTCLLERCEVISVHTGILLILGICAAGGVLGAWLFQKWNIPQVVGYIIIGVLIGETGFGLLHAQDIVALRPFNHFALGLIGFLVGGELKGALFRKYGRQFTAILAGEGILAFLLVGSASTLIVYVVGKDWRMALAAGVVLGAIASATDPASTMDVLWENRAGGVLTSSIVAIVALDDALAMSLYGLGTGLANLLVAEGGAQTPWLDFFLILRELFGAVALGAVVGFILNAVVRYMPQNERRLGLSLGMILLCIGTAVSLQLDVILATMTAGIILVNQAPRRSNKIFEVIRSFSAPIYIVFFVLVGARLSIRNMPAWLWVLIAAYVILRSVGKWVGAYWGGYISSAPDVIRRYVGMTLFAQGGVAVGLSIVASERLQHLQITESLTLGNMIIFTVTATTLCVQMIGPFFARKAVMLAKENGKNRTEADILSELKVADVLTQGIDSFEERTPLSEVVQRFAEQDAYVYPVTDKDGRITGILTFEMLKELLPARETWAWMVVGDVMQPVRDRICATMNLAEATAELSNIQVEALPVVDDYTNGRLVGVLDQRMIQHAVRTAFMRSKAESHP